MWPTELFWACWRKSIFAYEPAGGLMKWCERILLILWLSFCFTIMSEGTLWAGDCASPNDCGSIPDNGSRAAAAGAAAAGGGLAFRTRKNRKMPPIQLKGGGQPSPAKLRPGLFKRVKSDSGPQISVPGVGHWEEQNRDDEPFTKPDNVS